MGDLKYYWFVSKVMIMREVKLTLSQKGKLISGLVRPLLWLWILGFGMRASMNIPGVHNYQDFLVPGLLSLTLLFSCIMAAMSLVQDQQAGYQRLLSTAPVHRGWVVINTVLSTSLLGLIQVALLTLVLLPFGYFHHPVSVIPIIGVLILTAVVSSSIGVLIATSIKHFRGFATIVNFILFPMFFLSGALYPIHNMPPVLQIAIYINPFAHGVSLMHQVFHYDQITLTTTTNNVLYMLVVAFVCLTIAMIRYLRRFQ